MDSHIKTTQGNNLARFSTAQTDWHSTQQAFLSVVTVALWCIVRVLHLTGLTAKSSCMIFKFSLPFGSTPFCHSVISPYYIILKAKLNPFIVLNYIPKSSLINLMVTILGLIKIFTFPLETFPEEKRQHLLYNWTVITLS